MRAKKSQTSLAFSILIKKFCRCTRVPRDKVKDTNVTPTSSSNIWCIEVEYKREKADRRRASTVDTSPEIDVEMNHVGEHVPTPSFKYTYFHFFLQRSWWFLNYPSTEDYAGHDLEDGHLAHSADVRATQLYTVVLWMIESEILDTLTPPTSIYWHCHSESWDVWK